jgi:hypothetical protein
MENGFRNCYMCMCIIMCAEIVVCFDTHGFDVVSEENVPQVTGALVSLDIQLPLWTHKGVVCDSGGDGNYTKKVYYSTLFKT